MINVLARKQGNKARAAKILGVTRRSLYRLIEKYGLHEARAQAEPSDAAASGSS